MSLRMHLAVLGCAVAVAMALPGSAAAQEQPPFLGWTQLLPPLPTAFEPSSEDDCAAGRPRCVEKVIRAMERHTEELAARCDHDVIFALGYLRTTEEFRRALGEPGFFADPAFVTHWDVVFARFYFEAYEAWARGRTAEVPAAWRIAFQAARDRAMPAMGNFLLGMNAHVMRDLPFVLAAIGVVGPDDGTRKADHERVNAFLNRVAARLVPEVAARFDPTFDDRQLPTSADDLAIFQAVPAWRELAWRNAELLVAAPTEAARRLVAADIEAAAAAQAQAIRTAAGYLPPLQDSRARDAHCASHG